MDGSAEPSPYQGPPCIACHQAHPVGHCRLKMAGVEHCPLCGLAHYGYSRTCPHLRSEAQVTRMLAALKQSTEAPEIVQLAKRYLGGIRSDLAQRKRRLANKATSSLPNHGTTTTSSTTSASAVVTNSPVVDLTMEDGPQPALQQPPLSAPLGPPRLLQPPPFENQPGHGV